MLKRVLGDPPPAKLVRSDIAHEIRRRGGADNIVVYDYTDKSLYGKSLARDRAAWKLDPVEAAIRIQMEGLRIGPAARACAASRWPSWTWSTSRSSRGWRRPPTRGIALPEDGPSTHARFYGSFTRKIRHYAIERGAITLEHAVRAVDLAAGADHAADGSRRRSAKAWPPTSSSSTCNTIRDKATFFEPHQHSEGIEYVFVNGVARVRDGRLVDALPGRVLTRTAR